MLTRPLLGLAVLAALAGPAPAAPAKPQPKPAAAAKPAPPAFDARDPASLIALLGTMQAKAEVARKSEDSVYLNVVTPAFGFGAQYVGCNPQGKGCQGLAFSTAADKKTATLVQLNNFNQTSITCRVFQDKGGKSHVSYSTLLSSRDSRDEMRMHVGAWQGCLTSFGQFLNDPNGYLAAAP